MMVQFHIVTAFTRKACYIIFILLISISLSFGGIQAKSCKGGADCLNCAAQAHRHFPGTHAGMENQGCGPGQEDSPCGYEASQPPDGFHGIVSAGRLDNHEFCGIFSVASGEGGQCNFSGKFLQQFDSAKIDEAIPIYLLNASLLC